MYYSDLMKRPLRVRQGLGISPDDPDVLVAIILYTIVFFYYELGLRG